MIAANDLWGPYFFVERNGSFDVIWPGAKGVGEVEKERARNYFPRLICTCQSREDAELICEALAERLLPREGSEGDL